MHVRFSMVLQFLSHLPGIRSRKYQLVLSSKSYLPLELSTAYLPTRKILPQEESCLPNRFRIFYMLVQKILLPIAYVMEWKFMGL